MFTQARIKLTAFYVLIIIFIISVFSLLLFHYTVQHIRDNIEEDSPAHEIQQRIVENTVNQLRTSLLIADAFVVLSAGLLSYWLAGRTIRPIQAALDAQEQFSANASHELRTPLSVMRTENEVFLKNKKLSPDDAHALAKSNLEEINHMSAMVENLLILARSKKNDTPIEVTKVNISEVVKNVVFKLRPFAESEHISLAFEQAENTYILGNEKLFEHLFFNLIQNAITYTKHGKVAVKIIQNNNVTVEITDTGIGISEKDLKHIFEPFYKADSSRTVSSAGVGLGLSIVREIVEKYKGSIKIDSELHYGTSVTVTLPTYSEKMS